MSQRNLFERGSLDNLMSIWCKSSEWEREDGFRYYDRQFAKISGLGLPHFTPARSVAAFCALSPNNAESTNYTALENCIGIASGRLPATTKVMAYPINKDKAIKILGGEDIDTLLRGRKVYSFYRNTMDPNDGHFITVDGHMLGAWLGRRVLLKKREANINKAEYAIICNDFREAARCVGISGPRFQAAIWLTWKRIHRIVYDPQLTLSLEASPPE